MQQMYGTGSVTMNACPSMSDAPLMGNLSDLLIRWENSDWTEGRPLMSGVVRDVASSWQGDTVLVSVLKGAAGAFVSESRSGGVLPHHVGVTPCWLQLLGSSCHHPTFLGFLVKKSKKEFTLVMWTS